MTSAAMTPSHIHATRTIGSTGKRSLQVFFITRVQKSRVPVRRGEYFIYCGAQYFRILSFELILVPKVLIFKNKLHPL